MEKEVESPVVFLHKLSTVEEGLINILISTTCHVHSTNGSEREVKKNISNGTYGMTNQQQKINTF